MKTLKNLTSTLKEESKDYAEAMPPNTTDISTSTAKKSNLKIVSLVKKTNVGRHAWVKAVNEEGDEFIIKKETRNIPSKILNGN